MRRASNPLPLPLVFILPLFLFVYGCSDNHNSLNGAGAGQTRVVLTDDPGDFDAVNLSVVEIAAHHTGGSDAHGWEIISTDAIQLDLMSLQNGVFLTLADALLPAGSYDMLRLKLGEGSTFMAGGVTSPLTVPGGLQSGLKIMGPFTVSQGRSLEMQIDFDAQRSIRLENGTYVLQPVLRLLPSTSAGAISGTVQPASRGIQVEVLQGDEVVATARTRADGFFAAHVLPAGTYVVRITLPNGNVKILQDVTVTGGSTNELGSVTLSDDGEPANPPRTDDGV